MLRAVWLTVARFSALQRAENSSIGVRPGPSGTNCSVSVLFSEPKIPQYDDAPVIFRPIQAFQCSSASRKFLNSYTHRATPSVDRGFSALQRAENSSIGARQPVAWRWSGFSALQRAENSSIARKSSTRHMRNPFQCSSASRKFLNRYPVLTVSALSTEFQCSSASRKFLNRRLASGRNQLSSFQCSSASRKFLNPSSRAAPAHRLARFSALQRAENSSIVGAPGGARAARGFQCSSASRKFLNG